MRDSEIIIIVLISIVLLAILAVVSLVKIRAYAKERTKLESVMPSQSDLRKHLSRSPSAYKIQRAQSFITRSQSYRGYYCPTPKLGSQNSIRTDQSSLKQQELDFIGMS